MSGFHICPVGRGSVSWYFTLEPGYFALALGYQRAGDARGWGDWHMWCLDGQMEKGSTTLEPLSVYSRSVEASFLLHCQTLSHLSHQCWVYMHTLFSTTHYSQCECFGSTHKMTSMVIVAFMLSFWFYNRAPQCILCSSNVTTKMKYLVAWLMQNWARWLSQ